VSRGKVLIRDGQREIDVASCPGETLRRLRRNRISMVFQQFALMPWLTVRDNVGFGLDIRGVDKATRDKTVDEKLKLVRLEKFADKYAHELSGGMQQRVGLARAFATDASILLMDEPFSALDPLIREHLQDELLELQRALQKTIVFVSHDLDEALKIGTRIAIMEGGRIVQFGVPRTSSPNRSTSGIFCRRLEARLRRGGSGRVIVCSGADICLYGRCVDPIGNIGGRLHDRSVGGGRSS
jgi:glycine betaine/proline transport system ATP-binding protein